MEKENRPPRAKFLRVHPSALLLAAQLLQLVLYAVFDSLSGERSVLSAFGIVILMLVVWVVMHSPGSNWIAWVLAAPTLILTLLTGLLPDPNLLVWSSLLGALLYFFAAGSLIAYMMQDDEVTTDELFAVGATFTLLAWGYAYLYLVTQTLSPGSIISTLESGRPLSFIELLFLSSTNLTATGLGDIAPVSTWARVLVILEQFTGVLYVAMVVSRLVSLTIQIRERKQN